MNEIGRKITDKLSEIHGSTGFSIAFLPYKRSMWDSMESVYEECMAAGAATYCIPIPYQRIVSGQIESIDSDKDLFDNPVDITFLQKRAFDFVVIHYPYDDRNKVTRMCPEYHTAQLRKYGKVVYIPYACASMRFLRIQPGIANVDYAFLDSEEDAEKFVREWKALGVDFTGRAFGYGSPKMDAIEKCGCGSATLVINSLGPFLTDPRTKIGQYMREIQSEIDEGHDVIFRPHPLLRQTIRSMCPDVYGEYNQFIEWVQMSGAMVDESEDLEGAIGRSRYLISDPSSILSMWEHVGREYKVL